MNKIIYNQYIKKLSEAPLPKGYEPDYLNPAHRLTNYKKSVNDLITKIEKMGGQEVGTGSSRMAFTVWLKQDEINRDIIDKFHLMIQPNGVKTVIKLALNGEGIAQNKSELNFQKKYGINEFFLPIIDDSESNKGLMWGNMNLSNWIQMPYAREPEYNEWKKTLHNMFGVDRIDYDEMVAIVSTPFTPSSSIMGRSEEQHDRLVRFVDIMHRTGMKGDDLNRPSQWGIFNDKMYILDYGFDDSTSQYYKGTAKALTFVDTHGNITMDVEQIILNAEILGEIKSAMPSLLTTFEMNFIDAVIDYVETDVDIESLMKDDYIYFNLFSRTVMTYHNIDVIIYWLYDDEKVLNEYGIDSYDDLYNNYLKLDHTDGDKYGDMYEYLETKLGRTDYAFLLNMTDVYKYCTKNDFIEVYLEKLKGIYDIDLELLKSKE